jgi:DNA processing protein
LNELEALIALSTVPFLGSIKLRLLVQRFGSAQATWTAPLGEIEQLPGFGPKIMAGIEIVRKTDQWKKETDLIEKMQVKVIPWTSPDYPKRLLEIMDHPALLYVKGEIKACDSQAIGIVGTRHPTNYGMEMADQFGRDLASLKFTVVSGLARGIDTAAHRGALKKGRTFAVLGSGLASIYPAENMDLANEIANQGALISVFSMRTPPDRPNFPQRNGIVTGLSLGVLLIEAPKKSGAMLTMEKAKAHRRKRYALPGRICEQFAGNHDLIKQGVPLVENVQDIANSFDLLFPISENNNCRAKPFLEKEEENLLKQLSSDEMTLEEISYITQLPIAKLNVLLMSLMIKKAIREYPGKIYKKVLYKND